MKGMTFDDEELMDIKRFFKVSFAFFGKMTTIYCIESKDKDWKFTDKKNTPANDIVINKKLFS